MNQKEGKMVRHALARVYVYVSLSLSFVFAETLLFTLTKNLSMRTRDPFVLSRQ
jgi:hypothetical protein